MAYFRTIQTSDPDPEIARSTHEQKLNNYLNYDYAAANKDISESRNRRPSPEVESHSTTTSVKGNNFIITTTLCCEDYAEGKSS